MVSGTVRRRKRDRDGNPQGTRNHNPILDTRTYEVEFPDGDVAEYTANIIAQNMWAQSDIDGNQHLLMKDIVDFKTDEHAVAIADQFIPGTADDTCDAPHKDGSCACCGRTARRHGSGSLT